MITRGVALAIVCHYDESVAKAVQIRSTKHELYGYRELGEKSVKLLDPRKTIGLSIC